MNSLLLAAGHARPRLRNCLVRLSMCFLIMSAGLASSTRTAARSPAAAHLVKDIRTTAAPGGSAYPSAYTLVGDTLFFAGTDLPQGRELWKTNGTTESTQIVRDIRPGPESGLEAWNGGLVNAGGLLFFPASDGTHGWELWRSDGTAAGTLLVQDIYPGSQSSSPMPRSSSNGTLFFTAEDQAGSGLWRSDGTAAGTMRLLTGVQDTWLADVNGTMFFTRNSQVWKSDGTPAGTVLVKDIRPGWATTLRNLTGLDGKLFFVGDDGSGLALWQSDGSPEGTIPLIRDWLSLNALTVVNDTLFFTGNSQLWKSDGTAAGTVPLKYLTFDDYPWLIKGDGKVFFVANDGIHGWEMWTSDGSEQGTFLLKDINPDPAAYAPFQITSVNSKVFFVANDGIHGWEVWTSDGSEQGTFLLKDIGHDSYPAGLAAFKDRLFFTVDDGVHGWEAWTSDGTSAGTALFTDLYADPGSNPAQLTSLNHTLFFMADDSEYGRDLWMIDGKTARAALVKDTNPGVANATIYDLTNTGRRLFFVADNADRSYTLWTSNGTRIGTVPVKTFVGDWPNIAAPHMLSSANGTLFFTATDLSDFPYGYSQALWKSDGTEQGTQVVKVFRTTDDYLEISQPREVAGRLVFSVYDNGTTTGPVLWQSDGTADGTRQIDFGQAGVITDLIDVGGTTFFTTRGAEAALWRADRTGAAPVRLKAWAGTSYHEASITQLTAAGHTLFFAVDDQRGGPELWKSKGTPDSTVMIKDIDAGAESARLDHLTVSNGTLFFTANDTRHGRELWKSDGTPDGTTMIKDIARGTVGSDPQMITEVKGSGRLLFAASDGVSGLELWQTDGTRAGTVQVQDIAPGAASSSPTGVTQIRSRVFFVADDSVTGAEVWMSERP